MKKIFKSRWGILIIGLAVIILLIFFQRIQLFEPIENMITAILKPVQTVSFRASEKIKNIFIYFKDVKKLEAENTELKKKNAQLTAENLKLESDIEDSQVIKKELDYITEHHFQAVTAKIIGTSSEGYSQVLIINKGESAGVHKGYPVIANDGILIGKIINTTSQISKVLLLNDNHSEISVIVQNEKKSPGIAVGQYGISLKMELIPQDHNIRVEQLVTTSGIEENIPEAIVVGKINEVIKKEGELFQEAIIEPSIDYQTLSIITVILPTNE